MSKVLNISEAVSLAFHSMAVLVQDPEVLHSTRGMATMLGVSEAHLSKVLQRLHRAGLVRSVRGPRGGFGLAEGAEEATLLSIYEAIEGPLTPAGCLLSRPVCGGNCILGGLLDEVNRSVREHLAGTRLYDLRGAIDCAR